MRPVSAETVLDFWFVETPADKHFAASTAFDAVIRRKFGKAIEREALIARTRPHPWAETPEGALALIILFDQFPRNVWRGSGKAFGFDALALEIARAMIAVGFDWAIPEDRRAFVYMPFMHSERMADQDACVEYCRERLPEGSDTLFHAESHRAIIAKFGRFPARNDALRRPSTAEEKAYLASGAYAPGAKRPAK